MNKNQELFEKAKKKIINPSGTIQYMKNKGVKMGLTGNDWSSKVIDQMVIDYNNSKDTSLTQDGSWDDFGLYINLIVNQ